MEGQRVAKKQSGGGKPLILAGAAVGLVLAVYLGLCLCVGSSDKMMPNVSVLGLDVSGMTVAEAQSAMDRQLDAQGDQIQAVLTYGDSRESISASELRGDWTHVVTSAGRVGRENFLAQGWQYLTHLMGKHTNVPLSAGSYPALEQFIDRVDEALGGDVTQATYTQEGDRLVMTKGRTGVSIDRELAGQAALDAMEEALERKLGRGEAGTVSAERQLPTQETAPQEPDFNAIHREVCAKPMDAQVDPETYEATEHVVGVDFQVNTLKAAYEKAKEGETFSIPLTLTQPDETKTSLEDKLFRDLLGEGTTKVSGSSNRKTNVRLSAEACNGVVLLPGEEFSYNNTTGSRTADKGYLPAPIYVGDKSMDDVGGGICQTSSTIYFAVLHSTLEVTERHDHKFNTGYVTQGMDATVFFGSLDFRFRNNTDYPVKIVTSSYDKNGARYLNVKIYGTNVDGRYAVPKSDIYDKVTPTTVYKPRNDVPQGTLVLDKEQYAYTGYSAQTYRYIYEQDGTLVEEQDMGKSKYAMRPHIYYYNPLDGDPATWPDGQPPKPAQPETPEAETAPQPGTSPEMAVA